MYNFCVLDLSHGTGVLRLYFLCILLCFLTLLLYVVHFKPPPGVILITFLRHQWSTWLDLTTKWLLLTTDLLPTTDSLGSSLLIHFWLLTLPLNGERRILTRDSVTWRKPLNANPVLVGANMLTHCATAGFFTHKNAFKFNKLVQVQFTRNRI